jgi:hypothetical protein
MSNSTYGTVGLLATTVEHYIPTLEDNIFTSKAFLWAAKQADRVKNFHGTKIVQPLMYAGSPNVGTYADDDVFSISANTGISAAEFDFAQYRGTVHFTGIELAKNSGKEAILSLMEARMMQVEMTIAEEMNNILLGGSATWHGIEDVISDANPGWGNFGGINRSNTYWRAFLDDGAAALSLARMRTAYNTASEGSDQPTNIFTTQEGFESYEELLQDNVRYENTEMGDAGFQNLMYKGAPVTFDRAVDDGEMFFLNFKYITIAKLNDVWFKPTEFIQPVDQDAVYKHLLLYGNLIASNCKRQARLSAVTDA